MKKLLGIVFLVLFITSHGQAKVKSKDINFANAFYEDSIQSCFATGSATFSSQYTINKVEGLIGYDWHADHHANSNSRDVFHEAITDPIKMLMVATHNAIGNDNQDNIKIAKNLLIDLAKADTLYDSIGYHEVQKKPLCYAGRGDVNAPCWYHEYEWASQVFANYMISALWLRDELNEQEFKIADQYIKKMYKKFLQPTEFQKKEQGFYAMANGGTAILVYASWTNNKKLAAKEINFRFKEMDKMFYEDGYINNNSFRGVRAQWYHSYGLNSALGYVYIAKLWGAEIPKKLYNKLVKASKVSNLAITDYETFRSRPFTGTNTNITEDPKDAKKHTHQAAFAIDTLMKIVTGVELEHDPVYLKLRKYHAKAGIDDLIGFNPNCIHEELVKREGKQIEASSKLSIFELEGKTFNLKVDKVYFNENIPFKLERDKKYLQPYQLHKAFIHGFLKSKNYGTKNILFSTLVFKQAGTLQRLAINVGDRSVNLFKQHGDSLQKKCGSDLMNEWGWLSFISETRNFEEASEQQCHYDYFKEANDKQAWELFQAFLGGTNAILDYLETNVEL